MPHDGNPNNGRMQPIRTPWWGLAAVLAAIVVLGVAAVVVATGAVLIALPVLALLALGAVVYGLLFRRRAGAPSFVPEVPRRRPKPRHSVIADAQSLRRRSRFAGQHMH